MSQSQFSYLRKKINELRVIDLKMELEKRGIDKAGVKASLIERLTKALREEGNDPENYLFEIKVDHNKLRSKGLNEAKKCKQECDEVLQENNEALVVMRDAKTLRKAAENNNSVTSERKTQKVEHVVCTSRNLWISGLDAESTRAVHLKELFSKHGKIIGAKIVASTKSSRSRCYGFVTMASSEDASACIKHLDKTELHGRTITVKQTTRETLGPVKRPIQEVKNLLTIDERSNQHESIKNEENINIALTKTDMDNKIVNLNINSNTADNTGPSNYIPDTVDGNINTKNIEEQTVEIHQEVTSFENENTTDTGEIDPDILLINCHDSIENIASDIHDHDENFIMENENINDQEFDNEGTKQDSERKIEEIQISDDSDAEDGQVSNDVTDLKSEDGQVSNDVIELTSEDDKRSYAGQKKKIHSKEREIHSQEKGHNHEKCLEKHRHRHVRTRERTSSRDSLCDRVSSFSHSHGYRKRYLSSRIYEKRFHRSHRKLQHYEEMRAIEKKNKEELLKIEREKEQLRKDKEKLERMRADVIRREKEQQRAERKKIEQEKDELRMRSHATFEFARNRDHFHKRQLSKCFEERAKEERLLTFNAGGRQEFNTHSRWENPRRKLRGGIFNRSPDFFNRGPNFQRSQPWTSMRGERSGNKFGSNPNTASWVRSPQHPPPRPPPPYPPQESWSATEYSQSEHPISHLPPAGQPYPLPPPHFRLPINERLNMLANLPRGQFHGPNF